MDQTEAERRQAIVSRVFDLLCEMKLENDRTLSPFIGQAAMIAMILYMKMLGKVGIIDVEGRSLRDALAATIFELFDGVHVDATKMKIH